MIIGNVLGVAFVTASTLGTTKYGVEHYTFLRSTFGRHGVKPLIYVWLFIIDIGWNAVLAVMFGRAVVNVTNQVAGTNWNGDSIWVTLVSWLSLFFGWLILVRGPVSIKWFNRVAAPGLVVVMAFMLVLLFKEYSYGEFLAMKPLAPLSDPWINFLMVVELNVASAFSWWPGIGSMNRLAKTQRGTFWAYIAGLWGATVVAQTIGMMAALAIGDSDPTAWMIPLGGAALGVAALLWIAFANLTSMVTVSYTVLVALRQEGIKWLQHMRWDVMGGVFLALAGVLTVRPGLIYDNFMTFLLWSGIGYAPSVGICLVDYFVLRRQRLDLRGLYRVDAGAPYTYWRGWNWAAIAAAVLWSFSYLLFLNPNTLEYTGLFPYLSATLPSMVIAGALYYLFSVAVVRPLGKGGLVPEKAS